MPEPLKIMLDILVVAFCVAIVGGVALRSFDAGVAVALAFLGGFSCGIKFLAYGQRKGWARVPKKEQAMNRRSFTRASNGQP